MPDGSGQADSRTTLWRGDTGGSARLGRAAACGGGVNVATRRRNLFEYLQMCAARAALGRN